MALVSAKLFFRNNRLYRVGALYMDLLLDDSHSRGNSITSHRIESGGVVNDHIQNQPFSGSISGLISNFSLRAGTLITNRAQDAFNLLESIWKDRQTVDIYTVLKVYQGVGITDLSVARGADSGEALTFSVSFQEMNIVNLRTGTLEIEIKAAPTTDPTKQASKKLPAGKQKGG